MQCWEPNLVSHANLCENVGIFIQARLSDGELISWKTMTRNRPLSHTNGQANRLQAPLPREMNLPTDMNPGALNWDGAETAELRKNMRSVQREGGTGRTNRRNR